MFFNMTQLSSQRIKSLDGIRGLSILLVLITHAKYSYPQFLEGNFFVSIFENGGRGVTIFFVISGYLITKLLLTEIEHTGDISIKNFYLKRAFRIFPTFYLYILIIIILKITVFPQIFTSYSTVLIAFLYFWNYQVLFGYGTNDTNGHWYMGHFWSLSMEEQFYMLWPLMMKIFKINTKKLIIVTIALLIIIPMARVGTYFAFSAQRG